MKTQLLKQLRADMFVSPIYYSVFPYEIRLKRIKKEWDHLMPYIERLRIIYKIERTFIRQPIKLLQRLLRW